MYRIGSLFSGIGGLELGLERSGLGETAWYSEINKISSAVYASHWDAPNLGDIMEIDWTNVPPVDVVCGGFPCQPFSEIGKGEGVNDKRWLWSFIHDCLATLRPRWVVLENVRGLLFKPIELLRSIPSVMICVAWDTRLLTEYMEPPMWELLILASAYSW